MKYKIAIHRAPEGISVSVPALPGCWSEGATEEEALANIQDAFATTWPPWRTASGTPRPAKWKCRCSVPRSAGGNHLNAVRALEKAGFQIIRQGKHIVISDGNRQVTLPRHNPIQPFTMGGIVQDAGLTVEEFRKLL